MMEKMISYAEHFRLKEGDTGCIPLKLIPGASFRESSTHRLGLTRSRASWG